MPSILFKDKTASKENKKNPEQPECQALKSQGIILPEGEQALLAWCVDHLRATKKVRIAHHVVKSIQYYPEEVDYIFTQQNCTPQIFSNVSDVDLDCLASPNYCGETFISGILPVNKTCFFNFTMPSSIAMCFSNLTAWACEKRDELSKTNDASDYIIPLALSAFVLCYFILKLKRSRQDADRRGRYQPVLFSRTEAPASDSDEEESESIELDRPTAGTLDPKREM